MPSNPTLQSNSLTAWERTLLLVLAGIQFTHILDFMIMMPLGPQLKVAFGITDAQFGLLVSAYTLSAGVSGLTATTYIDRFERKRLLLTLYGLFALATLACGLAPGYNTLMVARVLAGLFGGVLSAMVQTIVGDLIPYERRGKAMGVVMTSFSVSTVLGVPASLLIANHSSWHMPFFLIAALSAVFGGIGVRAIPTLNGHVAGNRSQGVGYAISEVLRDANHWTAFAFSFCLIFAGFSIIPYITLYMSSNGGLSADEIPLMYLAGGAATLLSAQWIGRLCDRLGKQTMLTRVTLLSMMPMLAITVSGGLPLWAILLISTAFFVLVSGRMIPGMALVTAAANPTYRGTFMTLNSSVQSASMGVAALVGGHVISRNPAGLIEHYWVCAVIALVMNLLAVVLARRMNTHSSLKP
ncbi:MFS transporter [Limnobacter humi]|uniref:MFS transporter n=1 Tax=Limnobacter humi TaxID=1778671 RepID=A0ABT1WGN3_9BURK|nr:MFS transporter [Limnobacter humi]MCQ8896680.1 MFS transporter [Limnobacter humi]